MPTWKLTLEYDGTRYHGWQSQKNTDRTVQGVLLRAARELLGEDASTGGAGRTDAGVHAFAQVAHLKARKKMSEIEVAHGLNDRLPFDVNVLKVEPAAPTFHARHDAVSRTYLYRFSRRRTAFDKRLVWWVRDRLDVAAMRRAAKLFEGRHDFASFCENAEGQASTAVVVEKSEITDLGHEIHFRDRGVALPLEDGAAPRGNARGSRAREPGRGRPSRVCFDRSRPNRRNGPPLRRGCFWRP